MAKRRKMNDDTLKISKYEKYMEYEDRYKETWHDATKEWYKNRDKKRAALLEKFPHTVVTEGFYPVLDFASRWCWQNISPQDCEECQEHGSEYPGCPLVLAIEEYKVKESHVDSQGVLREWERVSRDPGKHGHEGSWTNIWLGKTGYDYGFTEWYFANEKDRDAFVAAMPTFGLGENYD